MPSHYIIPKSLARGPILTAFAGIGHSIAHLVFSFVV